VSKVPEPAIAAGRVWEAAVLKMRNEANETAVARSTGWEFEVRLDPGVPLRSTPGFTLRPAPRVEESCT
jgi:hypothetical protein